MSSTGVPPSAPLTAGTTWSWRVSLSDYPASDGWSVKYVFHNSAANKDFTSSADGDDHLIAVPAATSKDYAHGRYTWIAMAIKGAEIHEIGRGELDILPDPNDLPASFDPRSHARKTLDAIEAVIEKRASKDQMSYTIEGRRLDRTPMADLLLLKQHYQGIVDSETHAADLANGVSRPRRARYQTRFVPS